MSSLSEEENAKIVLVTANTGSLFEDPNRLLPIWLNEFMQTVKKLQPQFLALHLQEVGGKTYEKSLEYVQEFIRNLCEAQEMKDFNVIRIFMDEDFNSAEHFTALGNLYFAHKSLKNLRIWNFLTHDWEKAENKNVYSGNIETIPHKEKSKFPQHFFPECKWSRKGFMRTRWEINGTAFDLVNIHLFHDASNLAACEEFPSVYCKTRRRALVHTLERFHLDKKNGVAPYYIFGDFNFRCDTEGVIKELTENLTAHRVQSLKNDSTKVHYRNTLGNNILTIGKKEFSHADHQLKFKESWLKKHDRELEALDGILIEYPITFPPSYPYEEDPEMPSDYMATRCPSWCDRILMSPDVKEITLDDDLQNPYDVIGEKICMGDHKPIYLIFRLKPNQGIYRCCECYLRQDKRIIINDNNNDNDDDDDDDDCDAGELFDKEYKKDLVEAATTVSLGRPALLNDRFCPYKIESYIEILEDCKILNETIDCSYLLARNQGQSVNLAQTRENMHLNKKISDSDDESRLKYPPAINIIDSDNMLVCMCASMATPKKDKLSLDDNNENAEDFEYESVDRSICPECQNIIKKQPIEHRYRLISKRLMISEDIIVNRIDTQHLSTSDLIHDRSDPYTPESIESHSPYPELNSTTTTTSCDSRSPMEKSSSSKNTDTENNELNGNDLVATKQELVRTLPQQQQHQQLQHNESHQLSGRGIVSPGQLKSRLEDLQRKEHFSSDCDFLSPNNSTKPYKSKNTAGHSDSDVGVEEHFHMLAMPDSLHNNNNNNNNNDNSNNDNDNNNNNKNNKCLPNCCTIH